MGAESDPFRLLRGDLERLPERVGDVTAEHLGRAAGELGPVNLLDEVATMARRFTIGPLFLVHVGDVERVRDELERLTLVDGVDHRATVRPCPFVTPGTLLVITPEARAAAHDLGITDNLLANPQGEIPA